MVFLVVGIKLFVYAKNIKIEYGKIDGDEATEKSIVKAIFFVFSVFMIIVNVSNVINPVYWKSLSDPKVYITYQIMKKGMK